MKKLIAISVVFALVAGTAFAVDLGGAVIGTVELLKGDNSEKGDDAPQVFSNGEFNRIRLEGSGANDDGTFGGWIRVDGAGGFSPEGYAWWKPHDIFKLTIGGNSDGFYGKEGYAGWMFYQTACDSGVAKNGNVWGGGYDYVPWPALYRTAFYGGFGDNGLHLTLSPVEWADVNIAIPFISAGEDDTKEVFKQIHAQVDLKLDFGNIALTYRGQETYYTNSSAFYGYFNLGSVENLSLDVGIGFQLPKDDVNNPLAAGLAVKYDLGSFGFKVRGLFYIPLEDDANNAVLFDVLPYVGVSDTLRVFLSGGLAIDLADEARVAWHVNPYVEVGSEWGPKFLAGFQLWSNGNDWTGTTDKQVFWSVPIALMVSF